MTDKSVKHYSRLKVRRELVDCDVWINFSESGKTYEYPHDGLIDELRARNPQLFDSYSWTEGEYNWLGIPIRGKYAWLQEWLSDYRVDFSDEVNYSPTYPNRSTKRSSVADLECESAAYLQSVREWREYWRPANVRYLLIAESHVREEPGDVEQRVTSLEKYGVPDHPESFCRLIYCLGYGEDEILTTSLGYRKNPGTLQFWDIFGALAQLDIDHPLAKQPRRRESTFDERIKWKVDTLERLKDMGIWLIDACPIGLATNGTNKEKIEIVVDEFRWLFSNLVLPQINNDSIERSWIIGKGVDDNIRGLAPALEGFIHQPQSRGSTDYRAEHVNRLVKNIREAITLPMTVSPITTPKIKSETLPPGLYYIGDPSYLSLSEKAFDKTLNETGVFTNEKNQKCAVFSTWVGDGVYLDNYGHSYMVDSARIAAYPIESSDETDSLGNRVEFLEEVDVHSDGDTGIISFGHIDIYTGPYEPDSEGNYVGQSENDKPHGWGIETIDNVKYDGQWRDGLKNGLGTATYPNGAKYVGKHKDGNPWNGIEYDKDGNEVATYSEGIRTEK